MTEPASWFPPRSLSVRNQTLPPWDRNVEGSFTDLSSRIGESVVTGSAVAGQILGIKTDYIREFVLPGFVRDARIVERPYHPDRVTYVCVTPVYPSRLYLEYGEALVEARTDRPADFGLDASGTDADGRVCIVVHPLVEGAEADLLIATDRRTYRIRLVCNPRRITIACSWTYPMTVVVDAAGHWLGPPGEVVRRLKGRGNKRLDRYILFELGVSMRTLFDRWVGQLATPSRRELAQHKLLHARLSISTEEGYPEVIVDAVFRRLSEIGNYREGEIRQFLKLPLDAQAYVDDLKRRATGVRRSRQTLGRTPSVRDLSTPFPYLSSLPGTCLDDEERYAEPPGRARRLVWSMGPLAEHAALFCLVAPRYVRRLDTVSHILRDLSELEKTAELHKLDLRLDEEVTLSRHLSFILALPDSDMPTPFNRQRYVRSLYVVMRVLRRYLRLHDPQDVRGLQRLKPCDPARMESVSRRLATMRRSMNQTFRTGRKAHVFEHAGRLTHLEGAASLNLEQVVITNQTLKAAATDLGEEDWIDIQVPMTIVDARWNLLPGKQECVWRIWNRQAFVRHLASKATDSRDVRALRSMLDELVTKGCADPVFEYRRAIPMTGSKPIEPFFVQCWRYGLAARPASLPARLQHKRHMLLRQLKLPGSGPNMKGLLQPDQKDTMIWRVAARLNRTIVFLDPFEHALRFAHLGLSSVLENCARTTAWLQQTQDRSGWAIRRLNKAPVAGFLAFDKTTANVDLDDEMSWFPVGPKHQLEARELVAMTCKRCGYDDGLLPELAHIPAIRWKRPEKEAWIFAYDGTPLETSNLLRFLRFLLPGFGRLTYHLFRHLVANAAWEAGTPGWMIRMCLNHGMTDMWEYYAEQSARQQMRFEAKSLRSVVERTAIARTTCRLDDL